MTRALFVGGTDDLRNRLFIESLESLAKFPFDVCRWTQLPNRISKSFVKLGSPFFESDCEALLSPKLNSRESINTNYLQLIDDVQAYVEQVTSWSISPDLLRICRDKTRTAQLLSENDFNHPKVYVFDTIDELFSLKDVLFFKPVNGSLGRGLGLYDGFSHQVRSAHGQHNAKDFFETTQGIMFQQYIKPPVINGMIFDIRYFISGHDILCRYARVASDKALGTNISTGAQADISVLSQIPSDRLEEADALVERLISQFNIVHGGIDVIFDENTFTPYILELNAFPGIKGVLELGFDPYKQEIGYLNSMLL